MNQECAAYMKREIKACPVEEIASANLTALRNLNVKMGNDLKLSNHLKFSHPILNMVR